MATVLVASFGATAASTTDGARVTPIARRRHLVLEHYVISTLSGLASTLMLESREATLPDEELDLLKDTLVRELNRR